MKPPQWRFAAQLYAPATEAARRRFAGIPDASVEQSGDILVLTMRSDAPVPVVDGVYGTALIFRAEPPVDGVDELRAAFPATPADAPYWWMARRRTGEGAPIWEVSPPGDGPERRLVLLSDRESPSLTRYLMHAAELRHRSRGRGDGTQLRTLHREITGRLDELVPREELAEDQRRLAAKLAELRGDREAVVAADAAMRSALPEALGGDDRTGGSLLLRLGDDIAYLEALGEVFARESRPVPARSAEPVTVPATVPERLDQLMCFAVDIIAYSGRSGPGKREVQQRLGGVLRRTLAGLDLDLEKLDRQDTGDGMNVVLPAATQLHRALPALLGGLGRELAEDNEQNPDRVRLRLSAGVGMIGPGALGFAGEVIIEVGRLLDSPPLRAAADDNPGADVVAMISDHLHELILKPRWAELPPGRLESRAIEIKEYRKRAWLWVPAATACS